MSDELDEARKHGAAAGELYVQLQEAARLQERIDRALHVLTTGKNFVCSRAIAILRGEPRGKDRTGIADRGRESADATGTISATPEPASSLSVEDVEKAWALVSAIFDEHRKADLPSAGKGSQLANWGDALAILDKVLGGGT